MTTMKKVMKEAQQRASSEAGITVPKDDGALLVYALLARKLDEQFPATKIETVPDADVGQELAITAEKIREMRGSIYELTDAVIAEMSAKLVEARLEDRPVPIVHVDTDPDWITRGLAASAAILSLSTLGVVLFTQLA